MNKRLIIGITGASGIVYGIEFLRLLKSLAIETHLVITKAGEQTRALETELSSQDLKGLADVSHSVSDISAAIASGSFRTLGMIVAPCSTNTLAQIAQGTSANLLTRAADVVLKERRRLVLMVRDTPFHSVHLQNMLKVTEMGGIIAPPLPAFYPKPATLEELVRFSVARVLDLFDLPIEGISRWGEKCSPT